ncbi:acyltransferase family protein [Corynebacterium striatum]|uniref:acyltransferase family protein n=1 Tax=Corynebacterium TaxID=1716 RepID=UPI0011C79FFC|nr:MULTISPECIES: acyltransferase family protein [Corynebacterium]QQU78520.1 acyltransferase [Corynebacterium striatum]TXS61577.1 acyltransferase [Corynebacterium sp. LK14]
MPRPVDSHTSYVPAIDGLRTVAVLGVLAYHLNPAWLPGGYLGVGMFFTLSGYLITANLMRSHLRGKGLGLPTFWLRRFRRLVPAVVLMLAVVLLLTIFFDRAKLSETGGHALSALFYVNNWHVILEGQSYFDRFTGHAPLDHMWSLSVEEQFYLFWPLVLFVLLKLTRGKRKPLVAATLVLAAVSFGWMAFLFNTGADATRVYEGTDTRAGGILFGAALAIALTKDKGYRIPPRALTIPCALLGAVGIGFLYWWLTDYSPHLYNWGLLALSVASVAVITAALDQRTLFSKFFGLAPLRWIGERSYGIYLWHLPAIVFIPEWSVAHPILVTVVAIALAAISWSLVEDPIRRNGVFAPIKNWWAERKALGTPRIALAVPATVLAAVVAMGIPAAWNDTLGKEQPAGSQQMGLKVGGNGPANKAPDAAAPEEAASSSADPSFAAPDPSQAGKTRCTTVIHVGDSTSIGMFSDDYISDPSLNAQVTYQNVGAQEVVADVTGARSTVEALEGDPTILDSVNQLLGQGYGAESCWVIGAGVNDAANRAVGGSGEEDWRVDQIMQVLGDAPVMWPTAKTNLDSGAYANANMAPFNEALLRARDRYPNLVVYDWASDVHTEWFLSGDDVHYSTEGNEKRAEYFAKAIALAFPADGSKPDNQIVAVDSQPTH